MSRNTFNEQEREYNLRQDQIETAKRESDEVSRPKVLVLHHNDADGFGAAYALWTKYGDAAVYIPVQYGQQVPDIPEGIEKIYIVDFSYDCETLLDLSGEYELLVIDHHKTAEADLAGLPFCIFDTTKAGCVLTWEYLYPEDTTAPLLLQYVADRDLWKWALPDSEAFNLFIATLPFDFHRWDALAFKDDCFVDEARPVGSAIKSFRDRQIESTLKNVRMMLLAGYTVPVVNCSANISEVGNDLCKAYPDAPFSVSYCDRKEGVRSYSLRSIGEFDVSKIAKLFGGGGHKNAAGFTKEIEWLEISHPDFDKAFEEHAK